MNSIHDMGGMDGLGPIIREENEPYFHYEWERTIFALFFALFVGGQFNLEEFRHGIERMGGANYLNTSYYEHWLATYEILLHEKNVVTEAELLARMEKLRGAR